MVDESTSYWDNSTLASINMSEKLRVKMGGMLKSLFNFHNAMKLIKMLMSLKEVNNNSTSKTYFGEELIKAVRDPLMFCLLVLNNYAFAPFIPSIFLNYFVLQLVLQEVIYFIAWLLGVRMHLNFTATGSSMCTIFV